MVAKIWMLCIGILLLLVRTGELSMVTVAVIHLCHFFFCCDIWYLVCIQLLGW